MTGEVEKLSGKLGIDTTDFKTALQSANRELRVLESGFKASAAALGDWTKDATGLESRVKSLTGQIDIQKLKVDALRAEHQRLVEAHGAGSRAAQDAEIKLNKETETLNKMQTELGGTESALQDLGQEEQDAGNAAEESGSKMEGFKSVIGGLGTVTKVTIQAIVGLGAAAITAVASMAGLGINAATTAEQFADLSTKTGISAETLQELNYASDILGTSLDTVTGAQARLVRSMDSATKQAQDYSQKVAEAAASGKDLEDIQLGDAAQAFQTLGVSVTDSSGQLRDNEDVFNDLIDALGKVPNEAERDALAMTLFGKSAQELNPLIKAGSAEIAKLKQEAHEMGAVMSEEDVAAASSFKDQLDGLKLGFQGIVAQIGLAFIPGLSGVADQAKGYLTDIVGVVQGSGGDVGKIAEGLGGILGQIVTDLAGQAPQLLNVGLGLIQSILTAITNAMPTLLPAATEILTSLIHFIVQALPLLIGAGVPLLLTLVQAIIQNLPMLIDAALQAIIALATGLAAALPELIPAIVQAIVTIVQTLVENLPMLVDAALQLILALANGLIAAIPILLPAIPQIIEALIGALLVALPQIIMVAVQLILALANGLLSNLPVLLQAVVQILAGIVNAFTKADWKGIGKSFIDGIKEGWNANWSGLVSNITGNFAKLVTFIKTLLGIASPSKVFSGIGKNMAVGLLSGYSDEFLAFQTKVSRSMRGLTVAGVSTETAVSSVQNNDRFDFYAPVIFQNGSSGDLAQRIKKRRF